MTEGNSQVSLEAAIKAQQEQLNSIANDVKKIRRRLLIMSIGGYIKVIIIIIPLVLAAIYLPPILGNVLTQYDSAMKEISGVSGNIKNLNNKANIDPSIIQQLLQKLR